MCRSKSCTRRSTAALIVIGAAITIEGVPGGVALQAQTSWRGLVVAPERRCTPYDADEYRYPQSVEDRIVEELGGVYLATRRRFATDLLNLTLAGPRVNRYEKVDHDAAEWLPAQNRCWFAARVIAVPATVRAHHRPAGSGRAGPGAGGLRLDGVDHFRARRGAADGTARRERHPPRRFAAWDENGNGRVSLCSCGTGTATVSSVNPAVAHHRLVGRCALRAHRAGVGRTATARRSGEIIPTAFPGATARTSGAWTATTTGGRANDRCRSFRSRDVLPHEKEVNAAAAREKSHPPRTDGGMSCARVPSRPAGAELPIESLPPRIVVARRGTPPTRASAAT